MSVVRPHCAISAGGLVPPSSLLHTTEYSMIECPAVAAGRTSCHATRGVSVWLFWKRSPVVTTLRPKRTGAYLAAAYPGLDRFIVQIPMPCSDATPASLGDRPEA